MTHWARAEPIGRLVVVGGTRVEKSNLTLAVGASSTVRPPSDATKSASPCGACPFALVEDDSVAVVARAEHS